jgi:hypothetical protein
MENDLTRALAKSMGWDGSPEKCRMCNSPKGEFRDELSKKEWGISGMCQKCQDSVFGTEDEEG